MNLNLSASQDRETDWTKEVNVRLFSCGITKRRFAKMIDVNYSVLVNTLSGYIKERQDVKSKIYAGLESLLT